MKKILIVDDDPVLGMMIKEMLEWKGYWVKLLRIPQQTIEFAVANEIDIIILDKLISGVDGTEICEEIRSNDQLTNIPILMITAMQAARQQCLDAGANDFISKPFEMEEFLNKVKDLAPVQ